MSINNKFDDPDIKSTTRIYENMVGYGIMPSPKNRIDDEKYIKYKGTFVRDSCLSNENIEVNPKNQLSEFKHNNYINKYRKEVTSSTTISEGKYFNNNKEEKVFIKTIMAPDSDSLYDIKYNIEAYKLLQKHISEVKMLKYCDITRTSDKDKVNTDIAEGKLIVVAVEEMKPFKPYLDDLYNQSKKIDNVDAFEKLLDKLTETCDKFNSIGLYHRNLKFENIGIRSIKDKNGKDDFDVILTDFTEAGYLDDFTEAGYLDDFTESEKLKVDKAKNELIKKHHPPINSYLICYYIYTQYKNMKPTWLIRLMYTGGCYLNLLNKLLKINYDDLHVLLDNISMYANGKYKGPNSNSDRLELFPSSDMKFFDSVAKKVDIDGCINIAKKSNNKNVARISKMENFTDDSAVPIKKFNDNIIEMQKYMD